MAVSVADASLRAWCARALGSPPTKVLFQRQGMSTVFGYRLADGRRVVVKARHDPLARAQTCLTLQTALFASRYPCPRPLTKPEIVDGLTVHAEDLVDAGNVLLGDDIRTAPMFAAAYAGLLARLDHLGTVVDTDVLTAPPWLGWFRSRPWDPVPAVPDAVHAAAFRVRDRLADLDRPPVIGHTDWESQNLRWRDDRLVAVHDWDSLAAAPEPLHAGAAAAVFPAADQPVAASIDASAAFLDHYQRERGRWFSQDEVELAWAGGLLPLLHNARQEALEGRRPQVLAELPGQLPERLRLAGA